MHVLKSSPNHKNLLRPSNLEPLVFFQIYAQIISRISVFIYTSWSPACSVLHVHHIRVIGGWMGAARGLKSYVMKQNQDGLDSFFFLRPNWPWFKSYKSYGHVWRITWISSIHMNTSKYTYEYNYYVVMINIHKSHGKSCWYPADLEMIKRGPSFCSQWPYRFDCK